MAVSVSPKLVDVRANAVLVRRRRKIVVSPATRSGDPGLLVDTAVANIHSIGFVPAPALVDAMRALSSEDLVAFYEEATHLLLEARGGHRLHRPMYPGFPQQVIDMTDAELYANALAHYWTDGAWRPSDPVSTRFQTLEQGTVETLDLATDGEVDEVISSIIHQNNSPSQEDKDDLAWFLTAADPSEVSVALDPVEDIHQREMRAFVVATLVDRRDGILDLSVLIKSPTDVLRVAAGLSGGDVSLAEPTRFMLSRSRRRVVLRLLESVADSSNAAQEVQLRGEAWKRLAYALHVGESRRTYPRSYALVDDLRSGVAVPTYGGRVDKAINDRDLLQAARVLQERPGYFARRLDHLLRSADSTGYQNEIARLFEDVAASVATPLLLQIAAHFARRDEEGDRVFFPKGQIARAQAALDRRPSIHPDATRVVVRIAEDALVERFSKLSRLGGTYVDPALRKIPVPHAGRSTSPGARNLPRGSRIALPPGDTVRGFVWWTNIGGERVDVDLSAVLFDDNLKFVENVTYWNLRTGTGTHSGDIIDAPRGASEFIDYSMPEAAKRGRYVAVVLNSYTGQPFAKMECFSGWMIRERPGSGEVFDPKTVAGRADVTSPGKMVVSVLIDVLRREAVWTDITVKARSLAPEGRRGINVGGNNVRTNRASLAQTLRAITGQRRASIDYLLGLHVRARGFTADEVSAETRFGVELAFEGDRVASEFMG